MEKEFFILKKGSLASLKGVILVYARIRNPDSPDNTKSPVHDMAKNGLLIASGDYRTQHNLEDFLKKELGITLADLSNPDNAGMAGLPENINPDFIKRKMESLKGYEDLIPTPAKLMPFDSEQEILSQDADIFYLGEFEKLGNANLAVNAVPILYQALYREQVNVLISQEIEKLLTTATKEVNETGHYSEDLPRLENRILTEYIPEIIYSRNNESELKKWIDRFKAYMSGYKYPSEIDMIIQLAVQNFSEEKKIQHLIELYIRKIAAFLREEYKTVGLLKKEIDELEEKRKKE
jgi:hypothetical protein